MTSSSYILSAGKALRYTMRLALIVITFGAQAQQAEDEVDLYGQIQALQNRMNIRISGLEKIGNEPKARVGGTLEQQLRQALAAYNYLITQNAQGQIEKVVIIDKKQATDVGKMVLPTRYQDGHFLVSVDVSGNGKFWESMEMLIDTGADFIVLPESRIAALGMADEPFSERKIQTANGEVNARMGKLREVKIAGDTLVDVDAAFIEDRLLGNNSLLGMSALGQYKLVIDNQSQSITLFKK